MSHGSPGILHVNRNAALGGMDRGMMISMGQARKHGFRPFLACPGDGPLPAYARDHGFEVFECDILWMQRTKDPRRLAEYARSVHNGGRQIARICEEHGIGVLHPHTTVSPLYTMYAAKKLGTPVLFHLHDAMEPNGFARAAVRYFRSSIAHTICVSEASRQTALKLGMPPDQVQVIYNGIAQKFLGHVDPAPEVRGPGPHFGLVGLIVALKGQHVFLEAAKTVLKEFPDAHFWIIGPLCHPDDQPYLDRLHAIAADPALVGHVTFTGQREDVPALMKAMDAVVMTTVIPEALPNVVLEAMALGRPVVATNIGGQLEIIRDEETGIFVPPEDPGALAAALCRVARNEVPGLGERAAADVRARFTAEKLGDELAQVYNMLISRRSA